MNKDKTNFLDIVLWIFCVFLFGGLALAGWLQGTGIGALVTTGLFILMLVFLIGDLKKGVRPPTHYERFKAWMNLRPVVIGAGGLGLMVLAGQFILPSTKDWPEPVKVLIVITPVLIWAAAIFYTIWRAPRRSELDAAYQRRVGYKPPVS